MSASLLGSASAWWVRRHGAAACLLGLVASCTGTPAEDAGSSGQADDTVGAATGAATSTPGSTSTSTSSGPSDDASTPSTTTSDPATTEASTLDTGTDTSDAGSTEPSATRTTSGVATSDTSSSSTSRGDETTTGGDTETASDADSGSALPPLLPLSDEFDDPGTLSNWMQRHVVEGTAQQFSTLDIDTTRSGYATLIPTTSGWYDDVNGPLLFKLYSGDFMIEAEVEALNVSGGEGPPSQFFNSAGVMVRDPASAGGLERWVIHNIGHQDDQVGTERKITDDSLSALVIRPGVHRGRLRICRVGDTVLVARRLSDETEYSESFSYTVPELPAEVQVGLAVTAWNSLGSEPNFDQPPDLLAQWNYFRLYAITDPSTCLINEP